MSDDNVVQFKTKSQRQAETLGFTSDVPSSAPENFDDWRDEQVAHFLAETADLDGADPGDFWAKALDLRKQIDEWFEQWSPDSGS